MYAVALVLGIVFFVVFSLYRRSEADAPWWLIVIFLMIAPLMIWIDILHGRRKGR